MPPTTDSTGSVSKAWLIVAGVMFAVGCSADSNSIATYPVSGQVLYKGEPALGARVFFFFADKNLRGQRIPTPQATVEESGDFQVSCFDVEDGAPAGEYRIAIVWRKNPASGSQKEERPPDRLKGRYGDPRRSGLTASITVGENVLPPIQLK